MALPFALRPRIRLRDEPHRARTVPVPPLALPVAAYWLVMGLLTYGVSRAPALVGSIDAPKELPELRSDPPAQSPPLMATARVASGLARSQTLELAPGWKDTPLPSRPDVAARAPAEPVLALAPEARAQGHERRSLPGETPSQRATSKVPSCESALAATSDEVDLSAARGAPDLSRDVYADVLENGSYLSACSIPDGTALEICAAVRDGRAIGITVVARPADAGVSACVRGVVGSLTFPVHHRLDVTRTRFDAVPTKRTR